MTITMIRLASAITASLKVDYTAESVKTATTNISQNFGLEKIIKYGLRKKMFEISP